MLKIFFAICACLAASCNLSAQAYSGKVVDSISGAPIPLATIQYGDNDGVITNEEGYFQLFSKAGTFPDIVISCLGYHTKTVPLGIPGHEPSVIKLQEAVVKLDEVFLSNRVPDAEEIMEKVRNHIGDNYRPGLKAHQVFSRQTEYVDFEKLDFEVARASGVGSETVTRSNSELDSLQSVVLKNRSIHFRDYIGELYLKNEQSTKLKVDKASSLTDHKNEFSPEKLQRKAQDIVLQYLDTTQSYKLKTGILKIEDSLELGEGFKESGGPKNYNVPSLRSTTQNLLNTSHFLDNSFLQELVEEHMYDFSFSKATFLNGELIYILDFRPGRARSKYTGKVFVNGNDFAIVKADYRYADGKRGDKLNLKLLLGIKFVEDTMNGTILFRKSAGEIYEPSYVQQTTGSYFYVKRPLKLVENSPDKNKIRFNFTIEGKNRNKQELLLTSTRGISPSEFDEFKEEEDVEVLKLNRFEETLWENEATLQPLEEMREFNALN